MPMLAQAHLPRREFCALNSLGSATNEDGGVGESGEAPPHHQCATLSSKRSHQKVSSQQSGLSQKMRPQTADLALEVGLLAVLVELVDLEAQ